MKDGPWSNRSTVCSCCIVDMYRIFQQDLIRLKLLTGKEFLKSVEAGLNPMTKTKTEAIRINAEVHGLGPRFKLTVKLQNTATASLTPTIDLFLSFTYDENIYNLSPNYIEVGSTSTFSVVISSASLDPHSDQRN